jgi:ATP-dependent DNA helicase RecQ
LTDPAEKQRAWQRYHEIRDFVEGQTCRHHQICSHFGENRKWNSCGACDVCAGEPEWLAVAAPVKKAAKRKAAAAASGPARASTFPSNESRREPTHIPLADVRKSSAAAGIDPELRDYLREWRRRIAKERGTAAFIVMHDTSLDELCRVRPASLSELRGVSGFGDKKTEMYGQAILKALAEFGRGARAALVEEKKPKPVEETKQLLTEGRTLEEIAQTRGRQFSSVVNLIVGLMERGEVEFQASWVEAEKQAQIEKACALLGFERIKPLKESLPPEITYEEIRLVATHLRIERGNQPVTVSGEADDK